MNMKSFFVAALQSALDNGVAQNEDLVRHVTPELLAAHLPRPLWARLLTACLGAPNVDATLVVETIGVPNLCEHIPTTVMWTCLAEIGARSLGGELPAFKPRLLPTATPPPISLAAPPPENVPVKTPPPPPPPAMGPGIPAAPMKEALADVFADLERDENTVAAPPSAPPPSRSRTPTGSGNRFRASNTGIGRLAQPAASAPGMTPVAAGQPRRPQAVATEPNPMRPRRAATEVSEYDVETNVGQEEWKNALAVDDEQLVDWAASEETQTAGEEFEGNGKKR